MAASWFCRGRLIACQRTRAGRIAADVARLSRVAPPDPRPPRSPDPGTAALGFTLPLSEAERIRQEADRRQVSLSALLRELVRKTLPPE
jgi:Ribbon-helix-helix protein, copG family